MRTCGILMPVSSLPGPFGIGTLGKSAYAFVDFLKKAGQSVWQILPLSPTGFGDSPYQSCSAFAGNPYFIDLALLQKDGLLKKSEYANISWGETDSRVDYAALYHKRFAVLRKAFERFSVWYPDEYYHFCYENNFWLEDYALYMTIKQDHQLKCYRDWPADLRAHKNPHHGRHPHLCGGGLGRRVGGRQAVRAGRGGRAGAGGGLPARLLLGRRAAVGQPAVQLALSP